MSKKDGILFLVVKDPWFSMHKSGEKLEAEKHPDFNLKQLLAIVPTHYSSVSSAEGAIRRYAKNGIIQQFWKE